MERQRSGPDVQRLEVGGKVYDIHAVPRVIQSRGLLLVVNRGDFVDIDISGTGENPRIIWGVGIRLQEFENRWRIFSRPNGTSGFRA